MSPARVWTVESKKVRGSSAIWALGGVGDRRANLSRQNCALSHDGGGGRDRQAATDQSRLVCRSTPQVRGRQRRYPRLVRA
jgi:hypothetical protein